MKPGRYLYEMNIGKKCMPMPRHKKYIFSLKRALNPIIALHQVSIALSAKVPEHCQKQVTQI